jgi:HEAT repeat protein
MMAELEIQKKAVDALVIMNTAIKNMRLYPPSSAMILQTIDRLYQAFLDMFAQEATLIFAESEKNILICGEPLSQKDQERPQATALLEMLLNFGIKSITFEKGLDKTELTAFLEIMGRKPENVKNEGGLSQVLAEKNLSHILLDQKVYVARDKNQQILGSLEITDDQILQAIARAHPELDGDSQKVQEMARNPEWLLGVFKSGVTEIMAQEGKVPYIQLSENVIGMIGVLDKVAGKMNQEDQDKISRRIGKSIATMDFEMVSQILAQNIENFFGGTLMQNVVNEIDDAKFTEINEKILTRGVSGSAGNQDSEISAHQEKVAKERQLFHLKEEVAPILSGDEEAFLDKSLMASLPDIVGQLDSHEEQSTTGTIIHRLSSNLLNDKAEVRAQASTALVEIMDRLPSEQQTEGIEKLLDKLVEWIRFEVLATPAYEKICRYLKNLIQNFIHQGRFTETIPILDVFNLIHTGILEKNDRAHAISSEIIMDLASEELLDILFEEFNTNRQGKQVDAGRILVRLGEIPLNRLLDILREHDDSNERVRILHLLGEVGPRLVPLIRERISEDEPWYYLRNLAYLLGRVGSEDSVSALRPLLLHENIRVQEEALKSVYRTGGNERGPLLLSILPMKDDPFKFSIVEMLGTLKFVDAVPSLLELLKARPLLASSSRMHLEEKICIALGTIGAPEAIPVLSEIRLTKGFLGIRSYPDKIKVAAAKALVSIKRKKAEAGSAGR